jgi:hypothetical protein
MIALFVLFMCLFGIPALMMLPGRIRLRRSQVLKEHLAQVANNKADMLLWDLLHEEDPHWLESMGIKDWHSQPKPPREIRPVMVTGDHRVILPRAEVAQLLGSRAQNPDADIQRRLEEGLNNSPGRMRDGDYNEALQQAARFYGHDQGILHHVNRRRGLAGLGGLREHLHTAFGCHLPQR